MCYSPKHIIVPPSHCPSDSAKNRRSTNPFTNREERILRAIILTTPPNARWKPSGFPGKSTAGGKVVSDVSHAVTTLIAKENIYGDSRIHSVRVRYFSPVAASTSA
jgi:hypothetical protein